MGICGTSHLDTAGAITNLTAHFPAGTSVKSLNHYEQLILGNDFCDYDFGKDGNMEQYGQATPPPLLMSQRSVCLRRSLLEARTPWQTTRTLGHSLCTCSSTPL